MKKYLAILGALLIGCQPADRSSSDLKVTSVDHTSVKRQTISNCWLYAHASWLESKYKTTHGVEINVSETYWTYWDFYQKLVNQPGKIESIAPEGTWRGSTQLIKEYGWVEEGDFISQEENQAASRAQRCALEYINNELRKGGSLSLEEQRTPEAVRAALDKAFSCNGSLAFNMDETFAGRRHADMTMLYERRSERTASLAEWLDQWQFVSNNFYSDDAGRYEGKKLPEEATFQKFRDLEQRIKLALNDRQPVVLGFQVSSNAMDRNGLFNLDSLAAQGGFGRGGGHMVVLHDYTAYISDHPEVLYLGEGDMEDSWKDLALEGQMDYLVSKNSWGVDPGNNPQLGDGYARLRWDLLTSRYFDESRGQFRPFLSNVVLPPEY